MAKRAKATKPAATPVQIRDNLHNLLSGMGYGGDKTVYTRFGYVPFTKEQCDSAYRGDWIARKVIDIPAQDATREWRDWQASKDEIKKIEDAERELGLQRKTMIALQKARLYGGGALILGVDQGKPEEELDVETIKAESLKFIHAVSKHDVTAGPLETDVMSPYYGQPTYYERNTGKLLRLHPSRVVRFLGLEYPDQNSSDGWADPVLQIVATAIKSAGAVAQGVAQMVEEAKIDVIKIPDFTAQVLNADYEAKLRARFGLASDAKSIYRMLLLDKEEEWERITANFNTLPDIIRMYLLMASGAADIPATRLLGQAPVGMNATGDSDTRNYYDRIATEQETVLRPAFAKLDEVLIRSALGSRPDTIFYKWSPLWQMDEQQTAEVALKKAQVFKIDVDTGVLDGAVLKEARENQLIEDGTYPGIEQAIEEFGQDYEEPTPMVLPQPQIDPVTGQPIPPKPTNGSQPPAPTATGRSGPLPVQ